ncbi:MAG: TetR/AcrR family transcriptional regulator [Rhizobacter sp.]|nr:TetR/AcrR family transcriptional regulator [Burkholderiaceae bacterium]MCO5123106.1 TetR/AcrR family transcriptional regulator [Rhizobacter sp.]
MPAFTARVAGQKALAEVSGAATRASSDGAADSGAAERKARIEAAAYEVLAASGYKAASMLAIAKRASASNETLYNLYDNKQALFGSLVQANAAEARELLQRALERGGDPMQTLERLGPVLLKVVTSDKAIVLNRAAAGDVHDTGTLGAAIAAFGRETIAPLVSNVIAQAQRKGLVASVDPKEAAAVYFNLLIGDLQVRRVIGVMPEPADSEVRRRAKRVMELFGKLFGVAERSPSSSLARTRGRKR